MVNYTSRDSTGCSKLFLYRMLVQKDGQLHLTVLYRLSSYNLFLYRMLVRKDGRLHLTGQ
jgi:hypothetical protein